MSSYLTPFEFPLSRLLLLFQQRVPLFPFLDLGFVLDGRAATRSASIPTLSGRRRASCITKHFGLSRNDGRIHLAAQPCLHRLSPAFHQGVASAHFQAT